MRPLSILCLLSGWWFVALVALGLAPRARGLAFSTDGMQTSNSTYISVKAWDAVTLTEIAWTLEGRIMVFFDGLATDVLRFGAENETYSSSSSSRLSNGLDGQEVMYPGLPDTLGAGSDICNLTAYVVDPLHPFDNEAIFKETTVELRNFSTWWHTSTLGQESEAASATSMSDSGSAMVLLGDPGVYFACVVPGDEECVAADCVEFVVYQPNNDFFQVSSTNVGAIVTVRFNVASFDANLGDWGWVLSGVDPDFNVQDANELVDNFGSSAVYTQFSEGCWFYLGAASNSGSPFLCSRDPDTQLATLQASTLNQAYQYGSLEFYSAASGNLSIWYAIDEDYEFAMVHNYRTCGIRMIPPESSVVNTTSELVVVGEAEQGEDCAVGDGIPLEIYTTPMTFLYVDVPASIFFCGAMKSVNTSYTVLSVSLPVIGAHLVTVSLESGAILGTVNISSISGAPYAPNSVVVSHVPTWMAVQATANLSFSSRDFYSNDITIGYGDDAFQAWTTTSQSPEDSQRVVDVGNGSYVAELQTYNHTGMALFFVQRHGLNIPGSPFESYILGSEQCVIESLDIRVGACTSTLYRTVVHEWKDGISCEGGLALPSDAKVSCGFIPMRSSLGRAILGMSVFGAAYTICYLVWIMKNRKTSVVKLSQPFVCQLFLVGCIALNIIAPLHLGEPSTLVCRLRPCVLHTALTFASSCLYLKTYRVHRLFNNQTLVRMSISDRNLVVWVLRLVAFDAVLLACWMLVDGPHASTLVSMQGYAEVVEPICAPGAAYFSTILWVYKGGLNLFGVVMAGKTWHCADGVGESQSICLSVYNTTLLGLLNVGMHLLASDNIVAESGVRSFSAVGGTVFTVSAVFGPKAYKLFLHGDVRFTLGPPGRTSDGRRSVSTRAHKSFAGSTGNANTFRRLSSTVNVENQAGLSAAPRMSFNVSRPPGLDTTERSLPAPRASLAFRRPSWWYRVDRGSKVAPGSPQPRADDGASATPAVLPTDGSKNIQGRPTRLPPLSVLPLASENQVS